MSLPRRTFDFQKQLQIGSRGEDIFYELYHEFYDMNNDKNCKLPDFVHKTTGALVEVKYDDSKSAYLDEKGQQRNFFIEKYSNDEIGTLGGPFRAFSEGCDYYVYIFNKPRRIFIMDVRRLLEISNRLIESGKYRKISIRNRTYNTSGYALPISEFLSCQITHQEFISGILQSKKLR